MTKMRFLTLITIAIFLSACADTHRMKRAAGGVSFEESNNVYIAIPEDGRFGDILYTGSGDLVAQEIGSAFSPHLRRVVVGSRHESIEKALDSAIDGGFEYLIYSAILHWEDRATEWSGRPDVASVKISIIDVATGNVVDSAVVGGTSKIASWGGDRPEDLLATPINDYAAELFQ